VESNAGAISRQQAGWRGGAQPESRRRRDERRGQLPLGSPAFAKATAGKPTKYTNLRWCILFVNWVVEPNGWQSWLEIDYVF